MRQNALHLQILGLYLLLMDEYMCTIVLWIVFKAQLHNMCKIIIWIVFQTQLHMCKIVLLLFFFPDTITQAVCLVVVRVSRVQCL